MEQEICQECYGNGYVVAVEDMLRSADFENRLYKDCSACDSQGTIPGEEPLSNMEVGQ